MRQTAALGSAFRPAIDGTPADWPLGRLATGTDFTPRGCGRCGGVDVVFQSEHARLHLGLRVDRPLRFHVGGDAGDGLGIRPRKDLHHVVQSGRERRREVGLLDDTHEVVECP